MRETIKSYYSQFIELPDPLKMFIAGALIITLGFGIFNGVRGFVQNKTIERLEKRNAELNVIYQTALEKQRQAETNAANEALRAKTLEDQLTQLKKKEKLTDAKIITSQTNSNRLSDELHRVRVSSPANVGTRELERKICERYGNCQ